MTPILSPQARRSIAAALGECRRCEPKINFLKECGIDCQEREARIQHLKLMAETALALTEPGSQYGQTVG